MAQEQEAQVNQMIVIDANYQQAVEEFYREKRGSIPSFEEAWLYFKEEVGEAEEEAEERGEWSWEAIPVEFIDREKLAKELADVLFTAYGVAIAAGIDLDKSFQLVAESNMTKQKTTEGKVVKGDSYVEPEMSGALL